MRGNSLAKATGEAIYAVDIALPGILHTKTLRSPHAHARTARVDASKALPLPVVHAFITGADLPTQYGVIPWTPHETALAVDMARLVQNAPTHPSQYRAASHCKSGRNGWPRSISSP